MTAAPLGGITVVSLEQAVAAPYATRQLADLGARVIKVERPGKGDDLRSWRVEGIEVFWKVYARNKRSLVLDLKSPGGQQIAQRAVWYAYAAMAERQQLLTCDIKGDPCNPDKVHDTGDKQQRHQEPATAEAVTAVSKPHA